MVILMTTAKTHMEIIIIQVIYLISNLSLSSVRLEIELRLVGPDSNGYDAHTSQRVHISLPPGTRLVRDPIPPPPVPPSSRHEADQPQPSASASDAALDRVDIGIENWSPITPVGGEDGGENVSTVEFYVF